MAILILPVLAGALVVAQTGQPAKKSTAPKAAAPAKSQTAGGITPTVLARHVPAQFNDGAAEVRVVSDGPTCRFVRKGKVWEPVLKDCSKKFEAGEFMYVGVIKSGSEVAPGVVASGEGATSAISVKLDKNGRKLEDTEAR